LQLVRHSLECVVAPEVFTSCNPGGRKAYSYRGLNLKIKAMVRFRLLFPIPKRRRVFPTVGALIFFAVFAATQATAQQPDDIITTETSLVQLNVGVVDRQGNAVTSLSSGDFAVYEDGVRRPILNFEPTEAPFSLVLLLDMSGSTITFRQPLKQAAVRFLDALSPVDRVAVIQFNGKGTKSLLGFNTDRRRTAYTILELADGAGSTPLYEALKYSLKELAKEGKRRKAIVLLTDGIDTEVRKTDRAVVARASDSEASTAIRAESSPQLISVLTEADRQGVSIFPLALPSGDPKRLPLPDPQITAIYAAARVRLQALADRTGGRLNEIQRLDQLAGLYAEVAAYLRTLYTIAYQPPNQNVHDGKWRSVRIETTRPDLIARTKPGYFKR
jgi:VWFA-related protein